jgi:uncharacterized protein (DUF1501 family)
MAQNRRDFLKTAGCGLSMAALGTSIQHLGRMSAFAQEASAVGPEFDDYRALVCIFLSGGNDQNNMIVPLHDDASISNYTVYKNSRSASGLALPRSAADGAAPFLIPITVPRMGNLTYGLHPALSPEVADSAQRKGLLELWTGGKMAVMANMGNLVAPMTRTTYQNNSVPKPYQLFSHSDQVNQQQSTKSNGIASSGWGGRIADKLRPQDADATIPMITSIAGAQLFTSGNTTTPMAIGTGNLNQQLVLNGFNNSAESVARRNSFNQLRTFDLSSNVIKASSEITGLALQASAAIATNPTFTTTFPTSNIAQQLLQVARIISLRTTIGANRQIFFVQLGGFDTHADELATHTSLYTQLSQAMRAFYDVTIEMGIANSVTTFTLSDFGRTLMPSGSTPTDVGTDHAWASHSLIMGGSVIGGNFYGMNTSNGTPYPTLVMSGPDDTDNRGRWIPTTSVEQFAAVMANWFGVAPADLSGVNGVFPGLTNFTYPSTLLNFL